MLAAAWDNIVLGGLGSHRPSGRYSEIWQNAFIERCSGPVPQTPNTHQCETTHLVSYRSRSTPECQTTQEHLQNLVAPFPNTPSTFAVTARGSICERSNRSAIQMDFGNYTIGRMIPNRANYDDTNQIMSGPRKLNDAFMIWDIGRSNLKADMDIGHRS